MLRCSDKHKSSGGRAFTLIELLVLICIIGLLFGILVSVLQKAKEQARRNICAGNLRQVGLSLNMYADDNNSRLPMVEDEEIGGWLIDFPVKTSNFMIQEGCTIDSFYCSSNKGLTVPPLKPEEHWVSHPWRVTGYFWLMEFGLDWRQNDPNDVFLSRLDIRKASSRELVTDLTFSKQNNFTRIWSGSDHFRSNHISGERPAGGNLLFCDGSVIWRKFEQMYIQHRGKRRNTDHWW